jgi:two-component system sensor histidine kinase TctE
MPLRSLRSKLVFWTITPLSAIAALDVALSYYSSLQVANLTQEAQLMGSARMIAEQVGYADGALSVSIPPAALELFDWPMGNTQRDQVFYRVSAPDGRLLSGYFEMARPEQPLPAEAHLFFDAEMRGERVRTVAYAAPVLASPLKRPVLIEVAQTLHSRDAFARDIWIKSAGEHLFILAAATLLIVIALRYALSPVMALRDQVLGRRPGALEPLDTRAIPSELKPVVAAINDYVARLGGHLAEHDRFVADASHQLRTPLSVFATQVGYALQQNDVAEKDAALRGLREGLRRTTRLVAQLLAYTEADTRRMRPAAPEPVDIVGVAKQVLEELALPAQAKDIDLGYEGPTQPLLVSASTHELSVLLANLADNAVRYTPRGGRVTVRAAMDDSGSVLLSVEDNGPGIAEAERERVFERFHRLHGEDEPGCGLGLAIVREIATRFGIDVSLSTPAGGIGTLVSLRFPPPGRKASPRATNR